MTCLTDYKHDVFSQFGEDGVIAHVFERIGVEHMVAVEFGAGDGLSCSNTAALWRERDWEGFLVEPDPERFDALEGNAGPFDTILTRAFVTPDGPDSIDEMLVRHDVGLVDFMSIDVDGDDYYILAGLTIRPRVIAVEFNPTIPPHLDVRQPGPGGAFGASLLALIRLAEGMAYTFVGATYCNAFFVDAPLAVAFTGYETDPGVLFPPGHYTYAVTDFAGRVALVGQIPPWGTREPYVESLEASAYVTPPTDNPQEIRRGFESLWGPSLLLSPDGLSTERLVDHLTVRSPLVCVDLSTANMDSMGWVAETAESCGYRALLVGRVLGLINIGPAMKGVPDG